MNAEVIRAVENLAWWTRRQVVDDPLRRLSASLDARFAAQQIFTTTKVLPHLRSVYEAEGPIGRIDRMLKILAQFSYQPTERVYKTELEAVFIGGAKQAALDIGLAYVSPDAAIRNYLEKHSADKLGKDIDAFTRERVRRVLVRSYEDKLTYNQTVKAVRDLYKGFSVKARQGHIRSRAELIANTELGNAYSMGALESARTLERLGGTMQKAWAVSSNACAICQPNADQGWIDLEEHFSSGDLAPVAHPACRCSLLTRVKPQQ